MKREKVWTHNGISKTLSEWGNDIGMSARALRIRLRNGWDFERAVTTPNMNYRYEYKGEKYTISELVAMNGTLTIGGVEARIRRGMSVADIIEIPKGMIGKSTLKGHIPKKKCDFDCFNCPYDDCYC